MKVIFHYFLTCYLLYEHNRYIEINYMKCYPICINILSEIIIIRASQSNSRQCLSNWIKNDLNTVDL